MGKKKCGKCQKKKCKCVIYEQTYSSYPYGYGCNVNPYPYGGGCNINPYPYAGGACNINPYPYAGGACGINKYPYVGSGCNVNPYVYNRPIETPCAYVNNCSSCPYK